MEAGTTSRAGVEMVAGVPTTGMEVVAGMTLMQLKMNGMVEVAAPTLDHLGGRIGSGFLHFIFSMPYRYLCLTDDLCLTVYCTVNDHQLCALHIVYHHHTHTLH